LQVGRLPPSDQQNNDKDRKDKKNHRTLRVLIPKKFAFTYRKVGHHRAGYQQFGYLRCGGKKYHHLLSIASHKQYNVLHCQLLRPIFSGRQVT
jgi:hypothetical protein